MNTTVGYQGGATKNPSYQAVCSGNTGHAETVEVVYDPSKIKYKQLIDVFWTVHNPSSTYTNRSGSQYRSVLFYRTPEQCEQAKVAIAEHEKQSGKKVLTEVQLAPVFWKAEDYHQQYFQKNGMGACFAP